MSPRNILHVVEENIRGKVSWKNLPLELKKALHDNEKRYEKLILEYSLKNQLRYRGNLVHTTFGHEKMYYEKLIEENIRALHLFPYHLADIVAKGLRLTPFNYYIDMLVFLLNHDKNYDSLPNFTAADCLRVVGIGRNEYLTISSDLKTSSPKLFFKRNPYYLLPKFPRRIVIEHWWKVEVGYVLESDVQFLSQDELTVLDRLIDYGAQTAGALDCEVVHSLYRKGLIYLDVPISGEDKISIPPLQNFVMNRVSGDHFENLLYNVFVTADEQSTIADLANILQVPLDTVKQATSLFCRLSFARRKQSSFTNNVEPHESWKNARRDLQQQQQTGRTIFNYHSLLLSQESVESEQSERAADLTIGSLDSPSPAEDSPGDYSNLSDAKPEESRSPDAKRVGFIFDSTLTAFLMMGNLSPGLKTHAVTLFEVGKLCDEGMNDFLRELEKVSILDADGEGEVSRYFHHAIILRSTIVALKTVLNTELDLLRLESLEALDQKTRNRLLEKKYKFLIAAAPLSGVLSSPFTIPFFGQFYRTSTNSHIWSKLFYYHMGGYGPPSLLLTKGTVLHHLPRLFLGYGKLLITIVHTESFVLNSEKYTSLNEHLKNGCVLIQGYGIKQPAEMHYEVFPFDAGDDRRTDWSRHSAVRKLAKVLDLENSFGYMTFIRTGVPDYGCDNYDENVHLFKDHAKSSKERKHSDTAKPDYPKPKTTRSDTISSITSIESDDASLIEDIRRIRDIYDGKIAAEPDLPEDDEPPSPVAAVVSEPANQEPTSPDHDLVQQLADASRNADSDSDSRSGNRMEEWTLLDVHFGIPLFDVDCNTSICQHVIKKLCSQNNIENILEVNSKMEHHYLKFISQSLYYEDESMELVKPGKLVPKPRINLAFENGKIISWNGK